VHKLSKLCKLWKSKLTQKLAPTRNTDLHPSRFWKDKIILVFKRSDIWDMRLLILESGSWEWSYDLFWFRKFHSKNLTEKEFH